MNHICCQNKKVSISFWRSAENFAPQELVPSAFQWTRNFVKVGGWRHRLTLLIYNFLLIRKLDSMSARGKQNFSKTLLTE